MMSTVSTITPKPAPMSPYEREARTRKAIKLADAIDGAGVSADQVELVGDDFWAVAAAQAKTTLPSDLTRAETIKMLRARERARQ